MTSKEQKEAAKEFAAKWAGKGYEKGECQKFWRTLLHDVFEVADPDDWVQYELPVATGFVDAYIGRTKVLIEQKGFTHGLEDKAAMKQAMMYVGAMPDTMPVRYVVLSNFQEFWIYDKHAPEMTPVKVKLKDLPKKLPVLRFLTEVNQKVEVVRDISVVDEKAGALVGKLYKALMESYTGDVDERVLESLNMLCVRLVFCAYAEDSGVFPKQDQFVNYMRRYNAEAFRDRLKQLFRILNTDYLDRDPDDIPDLLEFPYVGSGLEIDGFAVSVAQTALWIAESQMMLETEQILHRKIDFLPLKRYAHIVKGNALRMDWNGLPHFSYILGNPPFIGYSNQTPEQKDDMLSLWRDEKGKPYKTAGKIDYVAAWYWKAAALMRGTETRAAFVSTNSITQGEQVAAVWKPLKERFGLEIDFAWKTFVWDSEANEKAHVHVVIVGFSSGGKETSMVEGSRAAFGYPPKQASAAHSRSAASQNQTDSKWLFSDDGSKIAARHINGYLVDADEVWIESRTKPLCAVPEMTAGNRPADGGHLILEAEEYDSFVKKEPRAIPYVKKLLGSVEFINNKPRYCLWLKDASPADLRSMPSVLARIEACRNDRLASPDAGRRKLAVTPHLFRETINPESYIVVPAVSSERREYVPLDFAGTDTVPTNLVNILPDATLYHFGVLTSSVHMAWMRAVAGRLEMRYRYSAAIVYNNFPWPENVGRIGGAGVYPPRPRTGGGTVDVIERTAQAILDARALYPDSSLADLYDPLTMPPELRKAHAANDAAVMEAYGFAKTLTEDEIVAELFKRYAELAHDCAKDNR